jgi:hypothetical protein
MGARLRLLKWAREQLQGNSTTSVLSNTAQVLQEAVPASTASAAVVDLTVPVNNVIFYLSDTVIHFCLKLCNSVLKCNISECIKATLQYVVR